MVKNLTVIICIIMAIGISGCSNPEIPIPVERHVEVTNFYYVISSKPASYWGQNTTSETCYLFFWIKYTGDILPEDVEYVKVTALDADFTWTIVPTAENFDRDYITSRYLLRFGPDGYRMPIGWYRAEIGLKNGEKSSINRIVALPGSKSYDGYKWIYTEECNPVPAGAAPMLARPVITSAIKDESITIKFTTSDANSFNGWVRFRNSDNTVIASSKYIAYNCEGKPNTILNGGNPLYIDGTENSLVLIADDCIFYESATFTDIVSFNLVISDGKQFITEGYCIRTYETDSETVKF